MQIAGARAGRTGAAPALVVALAVVMGCNSDAADANQSAGTTPSSTQPESAEPEKAKPVSPYQRVRLRITGEERFVYEDDSTPEDVHQVAAVVDLDVGQSVVVGLPLYENKHIWFELGASPLEIAVAHPDIGDPKTDVMLAAEIRGDWVDDFADVREIPEPSGSRIAAYSPGESHAVLERRIDARDQDDRAFTQLVRATVAFEGPSPAKPTE